ncbi:MAG: class I SAM-dependent rRNA methyltransferase [Akkermansiaceae bacterium]|nr:class I SAM-dependent rRNA methyltransferase [Akkermansiaceae bacterium]NNM28483.1 class I SAM-dependent rRNA methyltransferase [Akkermansiaceae bacterium]
MSTPPRHDLLEAALARRGELDIGATDAMRLVDGEGDDLPGIYLDDFAGHWLLSTPEPAVAADLRDWLASRALPVYWKILDPRGKRSPAHLAGPVVTGPVEVREHGVRYRVRFDSGYSQGLFLDQRDNRRRVRERCGPGDTVLNTFAYTGSFSVVAALAGATTTTLDLSQPALDWGRDHFRLNQVDPDTQHFVKGDTFHWLQRFARQGRTFSGIVLDPPTFSRHSGGKVFRAESDYGRLVELATGCLADPGWILCTTNCRGISRSAFQKVVRGGFRDRPVRLRSHPMPPDFPGDPYLKTVLAST